MSEMPEWTYEDMQRELDAMGWSLHYHMARGRATRFKFFCIPDTNYWTANPVFTAVGIKEARIFFTGLRAGCFHEIGKKAA
jgi:hypothetical protein